jgi:uncharacterized coiled-coil DUF342 family protein
MTDVTRLRPMTADGLNTLERDMQDALKRQQIGQAVEHVNEEDVGRLSAEAVLAQYEAAAKGVETMGDEIKDRISKLETAMREADEAMKLVAEAAAAIREKGKMVHLQIEEATQLSKDIRDACVEFRKKVGA